MRSKRTVWLALLAALAMVLAACSPSDAGDSTTTEADTPATTEAPAATTTTEAEVTETTVGGSTTTTTEAVVRADADLVIWADDTRTPVIKTFAEEFAAANDITVAVQELGFGDIRDRLITAGPAGEGPDVIIGAHDWLGVSSPRASSHHSISAQSKATLQQQQFLLSTTRARSMVSRTRSRTSL